MWRLEVPQFRRCCFCVPLRYGLLAWSYIKLVAFLASVPFLLIEIVYLFYLSKAYGLSPWEVVAMPLSFAIITLIDIVFTTIFIVAGHMKDCRGLRIYFYYAVALLVVFNVGCGGFVISVTIKYARFGISFIIKHFFWSVLFVTAVNVIHTYLLLLINSEIRKLQNTTSYRFVNNAAENSPQDKMESPLCHEEPAIQESGAPYDDLENTY